MDAMSGTGFATGRFFIVFKAFDTKITLHGDFPVLIELHGTERAGFHAGLAPNTKVIINKNDPLLVPVDCVNRACILAGSFGAMVTIDRDKKRCFFNYPDQSWPNTKSVFLFARDLACVATNTILTEYHQ